MDIIVMIYLSKIMSWFHNIWMCTCVHSCRNLVAFFSWTAALGKILSIINLQKRRMVILDWCCKCKKCGETMDNLLIHCPIALRLWTMVFCLFGLHWVCQWHSLICLQLVRDLSASIEILLFRRLCQIAFFGVFGKNGILEVLRDVNGIS